MRNASLRLRLSAAEAKLVRESQLRPTGRALRRRFISWLKNLLFLEGSHDRSGRNRHLFYGWTSGQDFIAPLFRRLQFNARPTAATAKFGILPVFHLANRAQKNQTSS